MFQAIILAGGEGKRMRSSIPKVLHQIGGKSMLQTVIDKVIQLDPAKIVVVCGKNASQYQETIKTTKDNILEFVDQIPACGTGDAVRSALPFLQKEVSNVLIVNADTPLIDDCLCDIVKCNADTIMVTRLVNPTGQGRICCDPYGNFQQIIEEKDANDYQKAINLVNCGIYFINQDNLSKYVPLLENNNMQNEYYLTDIFKHFHVDLLEIPQESQWQLLNVNTPEDLEKAVKIWESNNKSP